MPDGGDNNRLSTRILNSIRDIDAQAWNALADADGSPLNPFIRHEFLLALERSKSAVAETGWTPAPIILEERGAIVGAAPCYLKSHSFGEYVFDHHWAEAYERAGGRYYPKILCAAPFTPVPGPRLLAGTPARKAALAAAVIGLGRAHRASSAHINFIDEADASALAASGWLMRRGAQFHWFNRGYRTYEDFLGALASRKRKSLKRERREAADDLTIRRLVGSDIEERHWDAFWRFYQDTGGRKWGRPYLTRAFFDEIAETMTDRLMMVLAQDGDRPIAGALNFIGGDTLYGRYWGRLEDRPFLHFEICYHQAIDFAIERGLDRVEAGAQGEHKIARGYEPVTTRSAHWIANDRMRTAIERYLAAERLQIDHDIGAIAGTTPYKKGEVQPH